MNNAFFLKPDDSADVELPLPNAPTPGGRSLVFISQSQPGLNQNGTLLFELFDLPAAKATGVVIQARRVNNEVEITWSGNATLQSTDSLTVQWQDVPGQPQGSHRAQVQGTARFFRLKP